MIPCIVLFGGLGKRVKNFNSLNKALIKIRDKEICIYVIENLLESFKKEQIIIITNKGQVDLFNKILTDFFDFNFKFIEQESPLGISHAISLVEPIYQNFYVCLGDFYSKDIHPIIKNNNDNNFIILNKVLDPTKYGVWDFNNKKIIEKPKEFVSNFAVRGFYKFDKTFHEKFKKTNLSQRNEFEIVDVLNQYNSLKSYTIDSVIDLGSKEGILSFNK